MIRNFVTNMDRPVFALTGLPEEVVAVLFAYYSRSTGTLRENLRRLVDEGEMPLAGAAPTGGAPDEEALLAAREAARAFHEKWVVGYGHSSVAEHAVVHLALEDVSILASKVIEDARLASFTEKSTRYVVFSEDRYFTPPSLLEGPAGDAYRDACRHLLGTYAALMPRVIDSVKARRPRTEKQTERGWNTACKAAACDTLRYLLPASTLTNIGLTINARALEHLLSKMLSDPLAECRSLGGAMRDEARHIVPTLLKYADASAYLAETPAALQAFIPEGEPGSRPCGNTVRLVSAPEEPETDLATALLFEHASLSWDALRRAVAGWPPERRMEVIREALLPEEKGGRRGKFDQAPRPLERLSYTFEFTLDFGAFRDIQRHRMATQSRQRLTPALGYSVPDEIGEFGLAGVFEECMDRASAAWERIAADQPEEAQYVLPMAYRVRALFTMDLRELHHFISLRSGKQGHVSYRRIAQDTWKALHAVHPFLADLIRVDLKDYGLARG